MLIIQVSIRKTRTFVSCQNNLLLQTSAFQAMENSIDHDHEAMKTPLVMNSKKDFSFTELMFQFPTPSVFPQDRKSSGGSGRRTSKSYEANQTNTSCQIQRNNAKNFLSLPGLNSATKFANAINSLPSPICPVSTPLPLTSIGKLLSSQQLMDIN